MKTLGISAAVISLLVSVSVPADAGGRGAVRCGAFHYVRSSPAGLELGSTAIAFSNGNPAQPVTIDRVTIRDFFGNVVHDSGPAIGVSHPLNLDFPTPQDVTIVPPGAAYYLGTNHIWGTGAVPTAAGGGFSMSVAVEFSTDGRADLFGVGTSLRVRELLGGAQGTELSRSRGGCIEAK